MKMKPKSTDTYQLLSEHVERKQQLIQAIDATKQEFAAANDERDLRKREVDTAAMGVRDREERAAASGDSWEKDPAGQMFREAIANAKATLATATQAAEAAQKRVDAIHDRVRELDAAVAACNVEIEASEVLTHQSRLDEAHAKVENLRALLAEQEGNARQAGEVSDPLDALVQKREELLAESALGEDRAAAIAQLDAEIAEKGQAFDAEITEREGKIQQASQTAAGLRRLLASAETELEHLQALTPDIIQQLLLSEMEAACRQYLRGAELVAENYKRIIAFDRLLRSLTKANRTHFMPYAVGDLLLPAFRLKACEGIRQHNQDHGVLFSADHAGYKSSDGRSEIDRQIEAERTRFEQLGIAPSLIP